MTMASFSADRAVVATGDRGQRAHRDTIAHTGRFETRLHRVASGIWTMVGNGLSNQTFVEGPDGLVVIDTGECVEELAAALEAVRAETEAPVAAVVYTHFHYVSGTSAIERERSLDGLPIWGHGRIVANLTRTAAEIAPAYGRGLVHQFGLRLPADGPDGLVNVGLGQSFRNPAHAPFTPGFVPPVHTFDAEIEVDLAGLPAVLTPAPSDADDSITIWFPSLRLCVNNLVWPTLFNVFAIRGEEYRDPQVIVRGIDHLLALEPDHVVGTHGPPLSGADTIRREVTLARDAVQFLWDQTVRGINRGLTAGELVEAVQLPEVYRSSYLTRQYYGVAEHHVRQIHAGIMGWFDGDEARLFPLPQAERCSRLIEGFGGRQAVAEAVRQALAEDDLRWALELGTWLVRSEIGDDGRADGGDADERALLASVLRAIGQRTTAANIRNWTLTRALELEGTIDLAPFRLSRTRAEAVRNGDPATFVHGLRVLLDPEKASEIDEELAVVVDGWPPAGLRIRHAVAVPTDGSGASISVSLDKATLAEVLGGRLSLADAVDDGRASVDGDADRLRHLLACFDHPTLRL